MFYFQVEQFHSIWFNALASLSTESPSLNRYTWESQTHIITVWKSGWLVIMWQTFSSLLRFVSQHWLPERILIAVFGLPTTRLLLDFLSEYALFISLYVLRVCFAFSWPFLLSRQRGDDHRASHSPGSSLLFVLEVTSNIPQHDLKKKSHVRITLNA